MLDLWYLRPLQINSITKGFSMYRLLKGSREQQCPGQGLEPHAEWVWVVGMGIGMWVRGLSTLTVSGYPGKVSYLKIIQ